MQRNFYLSYQKDPLEVLRNEETHEQMSEPAVADCYAQQIVIVRLLGTFALLRWEGASQYRSAL